MEKDDLEWLGTWYQQQCNGTWEHQKGMLLEPVSTTSQSTAQTGWRLKIDLRGTAAAGVAPRRLALFAMRGSWLHCVLQAQCFEGEGAEVEELIGVFRKWVEGHPPVLEAASAG